MGKGLPGTSSDLPRPFWPDRTRIFGLGRLRTAAGPVGVLPPRPPVAIGVPTVGTARLGSGNQTTRATPHGVGHPSTASLVRPVSWWVCSGQTRSWSRATTGAESHGHPPHRLAKHVPGEESGEGLESERGPMLGSLPARSIRGPRLRPRVALPRSCKSPVGALLLRFRPSGVDPSPSSLTPRP